VDDVLSLSFGSLLGKHLPSELGLLGGTGGLLQLEFANLDLLGELGKLEHVHLVDGLGILPLLSEDHHLFGGNLVGGGGLSHVFVLEEGGLGGNTGACLGFSLDGLSLDSGCLQMLCLLQFLLLLGPFVGGIHGADVHFHLGSSDLSEDVGLLLGVLGSLDGTCSGLSAGLCPGIFDCLSVAGLHLELNLEVDLGLFHLLGSSGEVGLCYCDLGFE